jgi:small conductance mechanosensitive channel
VSQFLTLPTIVTVLAAVAVGAVGFVISGAVADRLRRRGASPREVRGARILISLIAVVLALGVLFVALGPLPVVSGLTLSAAVGLAATLALQTTISNVIAGFILLRDRVLRLNDVVQISGVTGRVVRIGLVTTWLRTDEGHLASVSNSSLLSGPLLNRSAHDRLQGEY